MIIDMTTLGERLKSERVAHGLTLEQAGAIGGTSKQSTSQIEKGVTQVPGALALEAWSRYYGINLRWLTTGKGPKHPDEATVDSDWSDITGYAQAVGLGSGAEAQEYAETHKLKFRAASLSRKGLQASKLHVMYGDGDSMLPRIKPGDAILFDQSDTDPRDGAMFVIQVHGAANSEYQVKRAMILDGSVYFAADNPAGDHAWKKPKRGDAKRGQIEIIGRVRWIGSWED